MSNSVGRIDQTAIGKLHLVTNLIEHIQVKKGMLFLDQLTMSPLFRLIEYMMLCTGGQEDGILFSRFFPTFLWLLRDVILELKIDDKPCTEDELLEAALMLKHGLGPAAKRHNEVRQELIEWFPVRHLRALTRPVGEDNLLRHVEDQPFTSLKPEFQEQCHALVEFIHSKLEPKRCGSTASEVVTGVQLAGMAGAYVTAFNTPGMIPSILGTLHYDISCLITYIYWSSHLTHDMV
jgi:hypothetical protein